MPGLLEKLLLGPLRKVFASNVEQNLRAGLNFGPGFVLTDNPANDTTDVQIPGVMGQGLPYTLDPASAPIAVGQYFLPAPGATTVLLVTAANIGTFAGALGIAYTAANPGQQFYGAVEDMTPASITGLGAGTATAVRLNTSTARGERIPSGNPDYVPGDIPLGDCNTLGDLLQSRGRIVKVNAMSANGGSLPAGTGMTAGNVLQATGPSSYGLAPVNLAGGANCVTGKLPVSNQGAPTGTGVPVVAVAGTIAAACVPINGANGVAGTDASSRIAAAQLPTTALVEQTVATGTNVVPIDVGTAPTAAPGTTKANLYEDAAGGLHHLPASATLVDEAIGAAVVGTKTTQAGKLRRYIAFGSTTASGTLDLVFATTSGKGCTIWVKWNARNSPGDCAGARGTFVWKNVGGTPTQATSDEKGAVLTTNASFTPNLQSVANTGSNIAIRLNGASTASDWTLDIEILDN